MFYSLCVGFFRGLKTFTTKEKVVEKTFHFEEKDLGFFLSVLYKLSSTCKGQYHKIHSHCTLQTLSLSLSLYYMKGTASQDSFSLFSQTLSLSLSSILERDSITRFLQKQRKKLSHKYLSKKPKLIQ